MRLTIYFVLFLLVLATPAALRLALPSSSPPRENGGQTKRLVILTVNNQDIRREFANAFDRWHCAKYGTGVDIDFRSVGGTSDMQRLLAASLHGWVENGQIMPSAPVDYDLVWGGGDYTYAKVLSAIKVGPDTVSVLRPIPIDAAFLKIVFPQSKLSGVALYDLSFGPDGKPAPKWIGTCLSSFGIAYNPDVYRCLGLPEPRTWADITNEKLAGMVALADPTHSGSAGQAYNMVQQRAMADAELAFFAAHGDLDHAGAGAKYPAEYKAAIDAGWKRGMSQLVLIAANARYFTDGAPQVVNDVGTGEAAAGLAIDFYARVEQESVGADRCRFIAPIDATAITPDPIGILHGVSGERLELAREFIEFVLSPEGQRLWILEPGQPPRPAERALRRTPIRWDVYNDRTGWSDDVNPFVDAQAFNQRGEWMALFNDTMPIWGAAWIDSRDELLSAYARIRAIKDDARRAALIEKLADIPITRDDVIRAQAEFNAVHQAKGDEPMWKAQYRLRLADQFRRHYREVQEEAE